jgi:hypothetical protein
MVEPLIDFIDEDIEKCNQTPSLHKNNEIINKYSMKHKFIDKICELSEKKLFVNFYLDFLDNYKTKSPQVILFINDFKRFLEKNKSENTNSLSNNFLNITSMCNTSLFNNMGFNNLYNINNITIGNIISFVSINSINNCSTSVINKAIEYGKSVFLRALSSFTYFFDVYREYSRFGNKELVSLCMRLDFSNNDVLTFGLDVIKL